MASSELDIGEEVAEPYRFNFEIAWEVANKGQMRQRQASVTATLRCSSYSVSHQIRGCVPLIAISIKVFANRLTGYLCCTYVLFSAILCLDICTKQVIS